jgi:hypothetical protein
MRCIWAHQDSPTTRIGEIAMQRRTKQIQARRRVPLQIDLFAAEPQEAIGDLPKWSGLPTDVQAALTSLMTRLLLEHTSKNRIGSTTEVGHDH